MGLPETVTLVNRTSRTLVATFDAQPFPIKPGKNYGFPRVVVKYAKDQNPLNGSEDPYNPSDCVYLVGVEEWGDDVSPLEQSDAEERIDRSQLEPEGDQNPREAVKLRAPRLRRGEIYARQDTDVTSAAKDVG